MRALFRRTIPGALGLAALLAAWFVISRRFDRSQFPGPLEVTLALREQITDGALFGHIKVSLLRFTVAYGIAVGLGVPLGVMLGQWTRGLRVVDPALQILRPISPIAWFPLAVLWFGVGDAPAIFIIALAAFFPVLLSTVGAVRNVPRDYLKVAATFGATSAFTARKVLLPAAFPAMVVGLRIALGVAWIHLVAGEMLGSQAGLGFLIVDARNFLRTDLIIAGMLTIGTLGLGVDRLMALFERRVRRTWGQI